MTVVDSSIANVALPTISADLKVDPSATVWIVNAYQIAILLSLLPLASLGDIFGYRRIYLAGLVLFTIASLACALSPSLFVLVLARVGEKRDRLAVGGEDGAELPVRLPVRGRGQPGEQPRSLRPLPHRDLQAFEYLVPGL